MSQKPAPAKMKDAACVITQTTAKIADKLAQDLEVSLPRMYEILSKDNPYPKTKRLIRHIAKRNPAGIALIKADMDALFAELMGSDRAEISDAEYNRELDEATQARLEKAPRSRRLRENREAMAILHRDTANLEEEKVDPIRSQMRKTVRRRAGLR